MSNLDFSMLSAGDGLAATYYSNVDLTGNTYLRTDSALNFTFGPTTAPTPSPAIGPTNWSARWVAFLTPLFSESYTFTVQCAGGVRLWVNGVLLVDDWDIHASASDISAPITLQAGFSVPLRAEYQHATGSALFSLSWQSASQSLQIVPQSQFASAETQYPDDLVRMEISSGLLTRGVRVNGMFLFTESCTVFAQQEVKMKWLIQGGPRAAISDFDKKFIGGELRLPLRLDRNGALDPAIRAILDVAETPNKPLRLDTNHSVSSLNLSGDGGGTDDNELLSFDCILIKDLSLSVQKDQPVTLVAQVAGMIDRRNPSDLVAPAADYNLGRLLSWSDCDISRFESEMRGVIGFEFKITNEIELPTFLLPKINYNPLMRNDQPLFLGVKSCLWSGNAEEILRRGVEIQTFLRAGWMVDENLKLDFGAFYAFIPVPVFKNAEQPLTSQLLKRRTEFFAQTAPSIKGRVFTYTE